MEYIANQENNSSKPITTYHEETVDNTLYRVTSVFKGEFDLKTALEDLTIRRVARESLSAGEVIGMRI